MPVPFENFCNCKNRRITATTTLRYIDKSPVLHIQHHGDVIVTPLFYNEHQLHSMLSCLRTRRRIIDFRYNEIPVVPVSSAGSREPDPPRYREIVNLRLGQDVSCIIKRNHDMRIPRRRLLSSLTSVNNFPQFSEISPPLEVIIAGRFNYSIDYLSLLSYYI